MQRTRFRVGVLFLSAAALALPAPGAYAATLSFGTTAPTPAGSAAISNWTGATFDADNVGGSGVNASGGANNGTANDAYTYVGSNRPAQGETFTTGSNAGGYTLTAITVRMPGYTNNIATGSSIGSYNLSHTTSTFTVRVGRISGSTFIPYMVEYAASGGSGNPGSGGTANGPGTYLTFTLKAPIVLQPNTVYAFDVGTNGDYFETLGIRDGASGGNPYAGGTAYTSGANGAAAGTITTQTGDRVFMVDLAPYTPPAPGTFVHPGLLNTAADFERMRTNVALGNQPWASAYAALTSSWMGNNPNWSPHAQATITRSGTLNNSSILYNDIAVAYGCALRWKISGDTAYADEAVRILNAWGYTFTSIQGDTNVELCNLYGYQFACVAEIMRTYPGWAPADFAQFQTMIYNVFYPEANNFLQGHNGTDYSHYWANWDLCAMDDVYAIGVLNDNSTLTSQATTYFYNGLGEGCVDRTVNFIHPGMLGQGQEIGRDQGHASLDIASLATFCQMAWNQGVDLFGYENNKVLAVTEYTAKYNLFNSVPFASYYSSTGGLMTGPSSNSQGLIGRPGWATIYNHYANIKGLAAPYTQTVVNQNGANWSFNGDEPGWDYLTASLSPIAIGANPSGLTAMVSAGQPVLSWWGSAYATGYDVLRSTTSGGPYTTIASGLTSNTYTDTSVVQGNTYYYVVSGSLSGGGTTGNSNEAKAITGVSLYAELKFDDGSGMTAADATGNNWTGTLVNGATWSTGQTGGAVNLASASSQYVSLPNGVTADLSDFTISAWVKLSSISTWARIFDIGCASSTSTNERYMFLAASNGSVPRFAITHSGGGGEEGINSNISIPTNQWVHVAVTMSGPIATLYINGNAVGQNRSMYTTPNRLPGGIDYAYIGKSGYASDPYLNGAVDDFRIYRGALGVGDVYTLATGLQPAAAPVAPTNLTVTAQPAQNTLSWTASSGATSYTVLRATSPGGPFTIIATIVPGTSYVDTNITAGTTYYYEVDGANSGGDGATTSASNGVVALPPLPSVPTGLNAYAVSNSSIGLTWTAAANAYTYNVERSLTSGGPYTTVATGVSATSYTDTGLANGTPYYYVVAAVNPAGVSANSAQASATPSDLLMHLPFDATSGSVAADTSGNGWNATLYNSPTWTAGIFGNALNFASASSQYGTIGNGFLSQVNDFTISVWVNATTLSEWARIFDCGTGTTNYMFLTVQGPAGTGKPRFAIATSSVSEQDLDSSIAIPTGAWSQITITHTGTTGCMYINGTLAATNTSMTLEPSSLGSTTNNYLGQSEWSSDPHLNGALDDFRLYDYAMTSAQTAAAANPPPTTPTNLTATPGDGMTSLSWAVSASATTYTVLRATTSGGPYTTVASGLSVPNYTDTGLTDGTTYYYVVDSVNWLGQSGNSNEVASDPYSISWAGQDVGTVAAAGSSGASSGTVTVNGSGADIWGTADAFQFWSTPVTGNCVITARVVSVQDINVWSKAGVMIRGSLAANSTNAALLVTPTTTDGIAWQYRTANAGNSANTDFPGVTAPYWVRLARVGTTVTGYSSPDGVNWTSTGSVTLALGSTAYAGLAVSSHTDGTLCTAVFDNVSLYWIPSAPTAVTATPGAERVTLSWPGVLEASTYNVKRSTSSGGPYTTVASGVTTTGYSDTGLTDGTSYYYVVSAVDPAGESANSSEVSAAPNGLPAQVTSVVVTPNSDQNALTWSATAYATSYSIGRSTTNGGPYTTIASGLTSTSYVDTGLTDGTIYYYIVTASDAVGAGTASSAAGSTPVSQSLFWDTTTAAGLGNGSGNWDINTTSIWSSSSTGTSNPLLPWFNDDAAYFQTGGAFTATIAAGTTIKVMSLNQSVNGTAATIIGGTLQFDSGAGITNAVGGGDSALTINSAIVLNSTSVTVDNELTSGAITLGGAISDTGGSSAIIKTGAGALILSGSNSYGGPTTISAGTLQFNSAASMSSTSTLTISTNATLGLLSGSSATFTPAALNGITGGGTYNFVVNSTNTGQTLTIAAGPTGGGSSNNATVNVSSSTTGDTLKFGGTFGNSSNSGSAWAGATTTFNLTGANLILSGLNMPNNGDGGVVVASTTGNSLTLGGTVSTNTNRTLYAQVNSGVLNLNNTVGNGGGANNGFFVTLNGGNLNLQNAGAINTNASGSHYGITISGGTLDNTSGAALTLSNNPTVNLGGSFVYSTTAGTNLNNLNLGTGAVTLTVATCTITTNGTGTLTLGGAISGAGDGITKLGAGALALNGANTYTGSTTINAGALLVNGSLAAGSTVTVNSGAVLSGAGTINGAANLASGGALAPGNDGATGTLTFASGLNINGGGILNFALGTVSASDQIAITSGYVAPGSGTATINLSALSGFGTGTYTLISGATGISAASFTLGTVPAGYTCQLSASGSTLSVIVASGPAAPTNVTATAYNDEVSLTWSASPNATSYNVLRSTTSGGPYNTVASGLTATSYVDTGLTDGTTYYYVVTATNAVGTSLYSSQVSATPVDPPVDSYWLDNDVGAVAQVGNSSYSNGTFTLNGSGFGVTGAADSFDYTYQTLVGDGTIIARVATQASGESGVMMRETLSANSRFVDTLLQASVGAEFQYRTTTGGGAVTASTTPSIAVPYWVKLSRTGNVFTGYISSDGVNWTQAGSVTSTLASTLYVGMVQSSMTNAAPSSATFTNVSIVPTAAWASQDIGAPPIAGSSYFSNAVATVQGCGSDISGKVDQFRYTYKTVSGNCSITVRVASMTNTNASAKAGVMIRETLATGARHASVYVTPGSGVSFQWRSSVGGNTSKASVSGVQAPYWVRLVRSGNTFTASCSADGATWTTIGSQSISLPTSIDIGIPVCSRTASALCTATIDNITTSP